MYSSRCDNNKTLRTKHLNMFYLSYGGNGGDRRSIKDETRYRNLRWRRPTPSADNERYLVAVLRGVPAVSRVLRGTYEVVVSFTYSLDFDVYYRSVLVVAPSSFHSFSPYAYTAWFFTRQPDSMDNPYQWNNA
ncbi:hypothetical protein GWI33_004270 [Rhynchophorus ferrugineus]|uniref:Uncharacterized protein n=1 Tax=Rhynchophorus ferrugineus TaxID=354439 RepID=A0A834MFL3_RHYFE|nr:hypothetical protein GWI33_004270 [Rhynchophorus ferrugineus]